MAFKPRGTANTSASTPSKLRELLRQTKLNSTNKPEDSALFQMLDNLLLEEDETQKGLAALTAIVNNLIININIINNNSSNPVMMLALDGADGMDSFIPGPQGDKGDKGEIGPPGLDGEEISEPLMIRGDQGV